MTKTSSYRYSFHHEVKLDKCVMMMSKLLKKIDRCRNVNSQCALIPMIIHVRIPEYVTDEDGVILRRFLRSFRTIHTQHFVRFAMDILWVMEADSSDIFYSRDNNSPLYRDVIIDIVDLSITSVNLQIYIPFLNRQNAIVKEISRILISNIQSPTLVDEQSIYDLMTDYHDRKNFSAILPHIDDDLHILFVQNTWKDSYCPIPLFGMTAKDAYLRYIHAKKQIAFLQAKHHDLLIEDIPDENALFYLIQAIQANEEIGDRYLSAKKTYELAELVFSYYMSNHKSPIDRGSPHELILFETAETMEDDAGHVSVYGLNMVRPFI